MTDTPTDLRAHSVDPHVALSDVPMPGPWSLRARCRTTPSAVFFVGRGDDTTQAKNICKHCPVVDECLAYALAAGPRLQGIWAGTSPKERARLRNTPATPDDDRADSDRAAAPSHAADLELYNVLEQLVDHPGQWARVAHYANRGSAWATASMLRTGRRRIPPGNWEFEGRTNPAGGSDLYARHLAAVDQDVAS